MQSIRTSAGKRVKLSSLAQSNLINIPSDWLVKPLNEIAKVNPQAIDANYSHKEILYVDISSVQNFQVQRYERVRLDQRPDRAQRLIRKNDIIVSTVRPNLKAFAKIDRDDSNLVCSTGFAVIRPIYPEDADFVFNYIRSRYFEINIIRHMEGMAYPAITSKVVERSLVPYPSNRLERMKIASILSQVDGLIQLADKLIDQSHKLRNGILQQLVLRGIHHASFKHTKLGNIPKEWDISTIGSVAEVTKLAGFEYTKHIRFTDMGDIPVIRAQNVTMEGFIHSNVVYISNKVSDLLSRSQVHGNEVLMVFIGANTGNVCIAPSGKWHLGPNVAKITPINVDRDYLNYYLQTKVGQRNTLIWAKSTTLPSLSMQTIRKILVPLPALNEQRKISEIISYFDSFLSQQKKYNFHLQLLKKVLMQKLLTGKIRIKV